MTRFQSKIHGKTASRWVYQKISAEMEEQQRDCEYYEEGTQREVKAAKQHKLLKDQERMGTMEGKKCLENMYTMKVDYFKRKKKVVAQSG